MELQNDSAAIGRACELVVAFPQEELDQEVAIEHHRLTKAGGSWISLGVGLSAARTGWGGRSCLPAVVDKSGRLSVVG
jgi:hypothetical protein